MGRAEAARGRAPVSGGSVGRDGWVCYHRRVGDGSSGGQRLRRRWGWLLAAGALAILLLALRALGLGPGAGPRDEPPRHDDPAERGRGPRPADDLGRSGDRTASLPRWHRLAGRDPPPDRTDAAPQAARPTAGPRLAGLFEGDCMFGVDAHCREWHDEALRCDAGDAEMCVQLGDLLVGESPMQPLWGSLLLMRACGLGRDDVCARASRWRAWSRFGYQPPAAGAQPTPDGLAGACKNGNLVACGLVQMRRLRTPGAGPADRTVALAACRAGFRDVCGVLLEDAREPAAAIAALEAGCDIPDAWMCYWLSAAYGQNCPLEHPSACPDPDPVRARHYVTLACSLEPALRPCDHGD